MPLNIKMNPLRDRTIERLRTSLFAKCGTDIAAKCCAMGKDYRKKYASFICESEAQHPLVSWELADREDAPPLVILHYRGHRQTVAGQDPTYKELFSVTTENKDGRVGGYEVRFDVLSRQFSVFRSQFSVRTSFLLAAALFVLRLIQNGSG